MRCAPDAHARAPVRSCLQAAAEHPDTAWPVPARAERPGPCSAVPGPLREVPALELQEELLVDFRNGGGAAGRLLVGRGGEGVFFT